MNETLRLEINGRTYEHFGRVNVSKDMDNFCGTFSIEAYNPDTLFNRLAVKMGSRVRILVGNLPLMTGYVERAESVAKEQEYSFSFSGRDITCDLLDSTLPNSVEIRAAFGLANIIRGILDDLGLGDIRVLNKTGESLLFSPLELESSSVTQNAFEFIEHLARKKQVFINTDPLGNIVLSRGGSERLPGVLLCVAQNPQNNILESSAVRDYTQVFHRYRVISQMNPVAQELASLDAAAQSADEAMRTGRFLGLMAEHVSDETMLARRAAWERAVRRARALTYTCATLSFLNGKEALWEPGKLVQINDDLQGVRAIMLLKSVVYDLDDSGKRCTLSFIRPESYRLDQEAKQYEAQGNRVATEWE